MSNRGPLITLGSVVLLGRILLATGPDRDPAHGPGRGALHLRARVPDVRDARACALGCFLYGAFVAKTLSLTWRDAMPQWAVPVLGGTVFLGLIGVWATSSLWLFTSKGWHF